MTRRGGRWRLITGLTTVAVLGSAAFGYSQFTPYKNRTRAMLEGNGQSCRESDGN